MTAPMLQVRARDTKDPRPVWPVDHAVLAGLLRGQYRTVLDLARAADADHGRALLLAGHALLAATGALTEAALAVAGASAAGVVVEGPDEVAFLREGGTMLRATEALSAAESSPIADRPLRRLARVASWTPWHRLPQAVAAPWAVAVTHNPLLRQTASGNGHAIGFRHGDGWLAAIRQASLPAGDDGSESLIEAVSRRLADVGIAPDIQERLQRLIALRLRPLLARARTDLAALRAARLPRRLWSGSGGNYAARALGLEVLRRGGEAVRFDHGGSTAPIDDPEGLALIELAVSSAFVAPTEELASHVRAQAPPGWRCTLRGGHGDATFRTRARRRNGAAPRPRVVYAPTVVRGFRKAMPPNIADQVYIDWQMDVAAALAALPVELVLRPHPEGVFRGRPHPLAALGQVSPHPFETLLSDADVLVFDCAASTTFWEAVCSDRPIVYLDLGTARFVSGLADTLRERLRTVDVGFDAARRPVVDRDALADAVLKPTAASGETFRRLFTGCA